MHDILLLTTRASPDSLFIYSASKLTVPWSDHDPIFGGLQFFHLRPHHLAGVWFSSIPWDVCRRFAISFGILPSWRLFGLLSGYPFGRHIKRWSAATSFSMPPKGKKSGRPKSVIWRLNWILSRLSWNTPQPIIGCSSINYASTWISVWRTKRSDICTGLNKEVLCQ